MRTPLIALAFALLAPIAIAQQISERPPEPAPQSTASFETREAWCQAYAAWFVAQAPSEGAAPSDVSPTHRFEVELNDCKLDPQRYEFDTRAELAQAAETEASAPG